MKRGTYYVTTFCNFAHRLRDGMPINHECYRLPVAMLRAEYNGKIDEALEVLRTRGRGRHSMGVKA